MDDPIIINYADLFKKENHINSGVQPNLNLNTLPVVKYAKPLGTFKNSMLTFSLEETNI